MELVIQMQLAAALEGAKGKMHSVCFVCLFFGGQVTYLNYSIKLAFRSVCFTVSIPF